MWNCQGFYPENVVVAKVAGILTPNPALYGVGVAKVASISSHTPHSESWDSLYVLVRLCDIVVVVQVAGFWPTDCRGSKSSRYFNPQLALTFMCDI